MIETYQRIIDDLSIVNLRNEVKQFYPLRPNGFTTNKWIGIHDEPENTIEKYIQDSYDFYLASQCKYEYRNGLNSGVVGFEWWIEYISTYNEGIPFCSSHDEKVREDEEGDEAPAHITALAIAAEDAYEEMGNVDEVLKFVEMHLRGAYGDY